jgi:uracil-DNA glycosylase
MANGSDDATTAFMRDLDERFQVASGLSDRRNYSIFYSRLLASRIMVIGIKPGGRRDGSHQLASQTFYEDNAHEYVDMDYRIAAVMRSALMDALGATDPNQLRAVPKTNCFFHRAVGTDDFSPAELRANAKLCAPFLTEMIAAVNPDVLVLEGSGARDLIVRHQCREVHEDIEQRVVGERRGAMNIFFRRETAWLNVLGREVTLLTLGHPSQFGHLPTWRKAVEALRANLGPAFLSASSAQPLSTRSPESRPATEKRQTGSVPAEARAQHGDC